MVLTLNPPPPTPVEPVTEILHGVPITDPYRWLEEQHSPRTRKWLEQQASYTQMYFDCISGRDRIRKRIEELLAVEVVSEPWKVGNRFFYLRRQAHGEQPMIMTRQGESGEEVVLVDPNLVGEDPSVALSILNISGDGRLLAYGARHGGTDSQTVGFVNVAAEQILADRLPHGFGLGLVFSADGRGFYYSHEVTDAVRPHYRAVQWHQFGTETDEDVEVFCAGESPDLHVGLFGSQDGAVLGYGVTISNDPMMFDIYLQNSVGRGPARQILESIPAVFVPFFVGHELFALTDWRSPNFRIVSIDLKRPDREHWVDVVPESTLRIKDFSIVGASICVGYVENLANKIEVFDLTGRRRTTVPCPPQGTASLLRRPLASDTLFYNFSSFDRPPTIFSYDVANGEQKEWAKSPVTFDPYSFEIEQTRYKSKDGSLIPMFLVARKGQRSSGPLPTFLTGYGGFGNSKTPQFNAYSTFLVEQGFLFAEANLRGGAEFGEEWHRAGKRHNRQIAIDDFISAAEWLLENNHAAPGKIAIGGGSNGGLLVGAALTQRPDLFRAVVCLGPLLDMLRYHLFDFASIWLDEYGTSELDDDFRHILAYSPYQCVQKGMSYPAVMLVSGDADTRCNPMHARKMAARLQAATNSNNPILLDYKPTWGHAATQPLTRRIEALTDRLAFIHYELGVAI